MGIQSFRTLKRFSKSFSICFLLITGSLSLSAENFRIHSLVPVTLSGIEEKVTVQSGINDALYITLPADLTYVSGVELSLKIPEDIVTWRDSVAYMLYENLDPAPLSGKKNKNYYGERTYISTIPGNFSLTIYIPISEDFSIKDSPYSVKLPLQSQFKNEKEKLSGIFMRFMMVMKGVPESLENSIIEITARPVLKNKGSLNLSVTPSSTNEKKYSVFIDDIPVQEYKNKILTSGEHHLSVISDSYRNELRTFRIEQAKTTSLSINLRGIEPLLKLLCPKDTQVFLDNNPITAGTEPVVITQGDHTIRFILGDYEVVKTISAMNGRTYSVNLNVDATISEED